MNLAQITGSNMLASAGALANNGTLVFYSGTQPATPESNLSGNTALVTFVFAATAFGPPSFSNGNEAVVANFVSNTVSPASSGTVTFARAYESNGTTVIDDFTVGTAGTDIVIGNTLIQTGVPVTINSFTEKLPAV